MKIAIQNGIAATISTLFLLLPTSFDSFVLADHSYGHARKQTELTGDLPRSFSANNRLIGFVIQAKPNLDRYESLLLVIDEYLSMCEGTNSVPDFELRMISYLDRNIYNIAGF